MPRRLVVGRRVGARRVTQKIEQARGERRHQFLGAMFHVC